MLNISERAIRNLVSKKELLAKKIGRDYRFNESDIQDYLTPDHEARKKFIEDAHYSKIAREISRKSVGSRKKGNLAMNGKKSKLPDRLNLGHGGYYRREYPLTDKQKKEEPGRLPMVRWAIWFYDSEDKKIEKIIKLADSPEDCLLALEVERKREFQKYLGNDFEVEEQKSYTFKKLADEYLKNYQNPRSFIGIRSRINKHLVPKLGSKELKEITFRTIKKLVNEMVDEGSLKGSAINTILKTLRAVFSEAKRYGWMKEIPEIKECFVPETDSVKKKVIPDEIFKLIFDKAPKYLQKMMIVARLTALRGRELRTLKWDCVDFQKEEIEILPENDKAKKGKKSIITPEILDVLKELEKSKNGNDFVFTFNDKKITRNRQAGAFKDALIEAGFKQGSYGFHELRHTAITRAGENGASLRALMDLAGHHSPTTTQGYHHSNLEQQKKAANSLSLNGKNGEKT